jgi:hypothetical protein
LTLTHQALGSLVGGRRSTITLALSALSDRGALLHQDRGWVLIERSPLPPISQIRPDEPRRIGDGDGRWAPSPEPAVFALPELSDSVQRLREQHAQNIIRVRDRLRRASEFAARSAELRKRIRDERHLRRRLPPSS